MEQTVPTSTSMVIRLEAATVTNKVPEEELVRLELGTTPISATCQPRIMILSHWRGKKLKCAVSSSLRI